MQTDPALTNHLINKPTNENESIDTAWTDILSDIKKSVGDNSYELWFSDLAFSGADEGIVTIAAPGSIYPIWIEENFKEPLYSSLERHLGDFDTVRFDVVDAHPEHSNPISKTKAKKKKSKDSKKSKAYKKGSKKLVSKNVSEEELIKRGLDSGLVEMYRFENFVDGENSEMAYAASKAVAAKPGRTYQPLFFYSKCGLGKTHLLHAIGWESLRSRPDSRVIYVTAEKFANDYITAIQNNALVDFRKKYREADMLLIDDVQFLERKDGLQKEFFHTFNSLADLRKQIVLASDCPASEIDQLEERLVSRFQWGLTVEIHSPGEATCEAILRLKRDNWDLNVDDNTIHRIVERVRGNVRHLEGALIRVAMVSTLVEGPITDEALDQALSDICETSSQHCPGMEEIKRAVAENYCVDVKVLEGKGRTSKVAEARQVAMYLGRTITEHSLVEIASCFGKDHGTVIYAVKRIKAKLEKSPSLKNSIERIRKQLLNGGRTDRGMKASSSGPLEDADFVGIRDWKGCPTD